MSNLSPVHSRSPGQVANPLQGTRTIRSHIDMKGSFRVSNQPKQNITGLSTLHLSSDCCLTDFLTLVSSFPYFLKIYGNAKHFYFLLFLEVNFLPTASWMNFSYFSWGTKMLTCLFTPVRPCNKNLASSYLPVMIVTGQVIQRTCVSPSEWFAWVRVCAMIWTCHHSSFAAANDCFCELLVLVIKHVAYLNCSSNDMPFFSIGCSLICVYSPTTNTSNHVWRQVTQTAANLTIWHLVMTTPEDSESLNGKMLGCFI